MIYKSGDIQIEKQTLLDLLSSLEPGEHSTFQILEKYQGSMAINKGTSASKSWNANFGKILGQCAKETQNKIIEETASNQRIFIGGEETNTSIWLIK